VNATLAVILLLFFAILSTCDNSSFLKTIADRCHVDHKDSFYFSFDDRVTLDVLGGKVTSRNTRVIKAIDSDHMKKIV